VRPPRAGAPQGDLERARAIGQARDSRIDRRATTRAARGSRRRRSPEQDRHVSRFGAARARAERGVESAVVEEIATIERPDAVIEVSSPIKVVVAPCTSVSASNPETEKPLATVLRASADALVEGEAALSVSDPPRVSWEPRPTKAFMSSSRRWPTTASTNT